MTITAINEGIEQIQVSPYSHYIPCPACSDVGWSDGVDEFGFVCGKCFGWGAIPLKP